jgi:hypothetical protein
MRILAALSFAILAACSGKPPCENDVLAFTMASQMVEERTAPSGKVGSINDSEITPTTIDGQCGFTVRGHVDGQNAFGGPVRQRFRATVVPDASGNEWSMRDFTLLP